MKEWAAWFYQSQAWKRCRRAYIAAHPLCERCLEHGIIEPAKIVHHKTYITPENIHDPDITLNWDNLEALCQTCHNVEHHGEQIGFRYTFNSNGQIVPLEDKEEQEQSLRK